MISVMANFVSQVDHLQNRETTHFIKLLLVSSLSSGFANDPFKHPFSLVVFFTLSLASSSSKHFNNKGYLYRSEENAEGKFPRQKQTWKMNLP